MEKKNQIFESMDENSGFLTYQQVLEKELPYKSLLNMVSEEQVVVEEKGLYRLPDTYLDEWFVLQHRFSKGIYSLDTALWLHGLTLTVPFEVSMSFPYGTNTKNIKEGGVRPVILRSNYETGIVELERLPGQVVRVYELERTLVECLRPIYHIDIQVVAPAFQAYFKSGAINLSKLFQYAKIFRVEKKLQSYLEVLQ